MSSTFSSSSWNGSGVARGDDLEALDLNFDRAGRQVRVDEVRRAGDDLPRRLDDELVPELVRGFGRRRGRVLGVDDELHDAAAVAEVDEDEAAVVAAAIDPAGERDGTADVAGRELAAVGVAPAHEPSTSFSSSRVTATSSSPGRRSVMPSAVQTTTACACFMPYVSWPFSERPA